MRSTGGVETILPSSRRGLMSITEVCGGDEVVVICGMPGGVCCEDIFRKTRTEENEDAMMMLRDLAQKYIAKQEMYENEESKHLG